MSDSEILYFSWDDEPCRLYDKPNGDRAADAYRPGKGLVEIDPGALYYGGYEIGEARYKAMVMDITGFGKPVRPE